MMKRLLLALLLVLALPCSGWAATYTDDFNRGDGALGANWTTVTGLDAPAIASNVVVDGTTNTAVSAACYTGNSVGADQFSEAKLTAGGTGQSSAQVVARGATGANTGYVLYRTPSTGQLRLLRVVAGSGTGIATLDAYVSTYEYFRIDVISTSPNTDLAVYGKLASADGWTRLTLVTDDSGGPDSGAPGIRVRQDAGASAASIDDWAGGDLGTNAPFGAYITAAGSTITLHPGTTAGASSYNYYYTYDGSTPSKTNYNATGTATDAQDLTSLPYDTSYYRFVFTAVVSSVEGDESLVVGGTADPGVPRLSYPNQTNVFFDGGDYHGVVFQATTETTPELVYIDKTAYTASARTVLAELADYNDIRDLTTTHTYQDNPSGVTVAPGTASTSFDISDYSQDPTETEVPFYWRKFAIAEAISRPSLMFGDLGRLWAAYLSGGVIKTRKSLVNEVQYQNGATPTFYGTFAAANSVKTLTGSDTATTLLYSPTTHAIVYSDVVSGSNKLFYRPLDADGAATGSEVEITADLHSLYSWRCFYMWNAGKYFLVYRSAADNKLYYIFITPTAAATSWGSATVVNADTVYDSPVHFSATHNEAASSEVDVIYYDSTNLVRRRITSETVGASTTIVSSPSLSDGYIQSPFFALDEYLVAYTSGITLSVQPVTFTSSFMGSDGLPISLYQKAYALNTSVGQNAVVHDGKVMMAYADISGRIMASVYDTASQTFDVQNIVVSAESYIDVSHNEPRITKDSNGYVYLAFGGRSYSTIFDYEYKIYKSAYPLGNASFTADVLSDWTNISPGVAITDSLTRGYSIILIDQADIPYFLFPPQTSPASYKIMEYRGGSWSSPVKFLETTTLHNPYLIDAQMNLEAGQQSIVIAFGNIPSSSIFSLEYVDIFKLIPDTAGGFTGKTLADGALTLPLDIGDAERIYTHVDNYPTENNLKPTPHGSIVMVAENDPLLALKMDDPANGDPLVGSLTPGYYAVRKSGTWGFTKVMDEDDSPNYFYGFFHFPKMFRTSDGRVRYPLQMTTDGTDDIVGFSKTDDDGTTWTAPVAIAGTGSYEAFYPVAVGITSDETMLLFSQRVTPNIWELRYTVGVFGLEASNIDTVGCDLTFVAYTSVTGAAHAEVHRATTSPVAGDGTTIIADNQTGTTYHDESASAGTSYYYVVVYKDVSDVEVFRTDEVPVTTVAAVASSAFFVLGPHW